MQVFDYHLNPKLKRDVNFQSFYFQPEDQEQEKLGSLIIVGELNNFLSKDKKLLDQLANKIKKEFYSNTKQESKEALNSALGEANVYLKSIAEQDSQRWLGNLHLAIVNIKDYNIHFSKSGNMKMLLLRGREYIDIADNLESQHSDAKKYFSSVASGNLVPDDKVIIITQYLTKFFETYLANHLFNLESFTNKKIDKFIRDKKEEMKEFCGVLLIVLVNKENIKKHLLRYFLPRTKTKKKITLILLFILLLLFCYLIYR